MAKNIKYILIGIAILFGVSMTIITTIIQKNNAVEAINLFSNIKEDSLLYFEIKKSNFTVLKKIENKSLISSLLNILKKSQEWNSSPPGYFVKYYLTLYLTTGSINLRISYDNNHTDCIEIVYTNGVNKSTSIRNCDLYIWLCTTLGLNCANSS